MVRILSLYAMMIVAMLVVIMWWLRFLNMM